MENLDLAKGITRPAGKFEDHEAHILEHKKLVEFHGLEEEIRQVAEAHIQEHLNFLEPPLTNGGPSATLPGGQPKAGAAPVTPPPDALPPV